MYDWCDTATAKDEKCDPGGLAGKSLPGECILWTSNKGEGQRSGLLRVRLPLLALKHVYWG